MKTTAKTLSRRVLGAILALCMLAGLLPMTAFAAAPASRRMRTGTVPQRGGQSQRAIKGSGITYLW